MVKSPTPLAWPTAVNSRRLPTVPFDGIEREPLRSEAERHATGTNRVGALGQNRSEALGRPLKDTEGGIELIGEARGRRWEGDGHQLTDEGGAKLAEVRLEVAVEMGRVRLLAGQGGFAVDNQTV